MPAVIAQTPTAFYGVRSSYDEHVKARTDETSGYRKARQSMLDEGAIDQAAFDAGNKPYTKKLWKEEQGSLDGPVIMVVTSGTETVATNEIGEDGKYALVENERDYDERDVISGPFPWVEITEAEYTEFLEANGE